MIPKSIAEVTTEWLSEVLGAEVAGHQPTQIGQGVGIMGDIYRVAVRYRATTEGKPGSVVVKLPSSFEENREQGVALGMFEAEVRFYNELAGQVPAGLPAIYHAEIQPGTADFVIVMEDLSSLSMVDQIQGMTVAQAHAAVRVLAGVHATWWDKATDESDLSWIPSMVSERIAMLDGLFPQIFPVFAEKFGPLLPPGGLEIYEQFTGNYLKINTRVAERSPWTLVHQDFRVENLLFGNAASGTVAIIDWQGIGRGPGAYDLGYLLGGSIDSTLRSTHEDALIRTYHDALLEHGVTGYTLEALQEDYGHAHLQGGLATSMLTGGAMDLSNERGTQLIATMACRHVQAAMDHGGSARLADIIG